MVELKSNPMNYLNRSLTLLLVFITIAVHAQRTTRYLNTKGWKGNFAITVEERDTLTGVTTIVSGKGPATLMNTNPKTPVSMVWPMPSVGQMRINPGATMEEQLRAGEAIQNGYLQWDATISYQRKEKKDEFPVDTRDFTCQYSGKKKSLLTISFVTDEMKESWFNIKGNVQINPEDVTCSGTMDGQPVTSLDDLHDPSVLNYTAEAMASRNLSAFPGPRFQGENNYVDGNRHIHVVFDFSPVP